MPTEFTPKQLAIIGRWQLDRAENFDAYMKVSFSHFWALKQRYQEQGCSITLRQNLRG